MKGILRFGYRFTNKEEIILRDFLAMERTRLANERTFMSYIRTSLFFFTGGLTLLQFEDYQNIHWLAYLAVVVSIIMVIVGVVRFIILSRRLHGYYKQIKSEQDQQKEDSQG